MASTRSTVAAKDDRKWFEDGLRGLSDIAAKSKHLHPAVLEPVRSWTLLKQVTIYKSLGVYLALMNKRNWRKVLIDTHSSCGINSLDDTKERVAGSALIGAGARTRFDHYYFVETDDVKRAALEARLPVYLPPGSFTVLPDPAERAVGLIHDKEGRSNIHFFSVVDPYNLGQMTWAGFEELLSTPRGDVVINFPTTQVKRHHDPAAVESFIGDPEAVRALLEGDGSEDDFLKLFLSRLERLRPKTVTIRIESGAGRYYYDLIYAAADTGGGAPWLGAIEEMKRRVEGMDGTHALEMVRSGRIDSWK